MDNDSDSNEMSVEANSDNNEESDNQIESDKNDESDNNVESDNEESKVPKKKTKRGIIYLSTIPPYMNVTRIREVFEQYGKLGRVYMQLAETDKKLQPKGDAPKSKKKKVAKKFTEGWVEFERKSIAKKVAELLNNKQVSTRKKSKHYDCIWNIKYLSGFKWTHLHERLAYEKASRRQKIRAEIQLAKKQTNFFTNNIDKRKKKKDFVNKQLTENNKLENKKNGKADDSKPEDRQQFLKSLFTS